MEGERRRPITSERATLDPFEALAGDVRPRDQRDLMERRSSPSPRQSA
jgi:hypothetical protein